MREFCKFSHFIFHKYNIEFILFDMKTYWTKEKVFEESKKYKTRKEFSNNSKYAYLVAWKNKWLDDMVWISNTLQKWNKESVINESKKYKTRSDFERGSGSAYHFARLHNLLDEMTWLNRPEKINGFIYCVYVYIDEENKVAYVGLTKNKNDRHYSHSNLIENKLSPVYKYFTNIGKDVPNPKYLEDNISCDEAREKEDYWRRWYSDNGYFMLNKGKTGSKCGSLGGISLKWSKKKVFEESKKYTSKKDFELGCRTAYHKAWKNNWLKDMYWLKYRNEYFTDEVVIEKSKEYKFVGDFKKYSKKEYSYAVRHKLLEKMTWLQSKIKKWTKEEVIEESKKYKTKMELYRGNNSAYTYAWKNHILDDLYPKEVE